MGYWDIFNEEHDKLIRIEGRKMSISWDGGETLEHCLTFSSDTKAENMAKMLIDMLNCNKVKVN
jgi:hypothetical protein